MPATIQDVDVDVNSTYDGFASGKDDQGNDVALKDVTLVVVEGTGIEVGVDADPTDNTDDIDVNDQVGAVTLVAGSARDDSGAAWEALIRFTNREEIPDEPREMTITWTKRVAA